jgi:hypothetical protein
LTAEDAEPQLALAVSGLLFLSLRAFGSRFLSIRLSPSLSFSFAHGGQSFLARGLLSDHRRFKRPHERKGASRCCFTVQINKIAQMEKTRDAVLVALLSRLGEIDIDRFVWLKSRHLSSCGAHGRGITRNRLRVFFR